VEENSGGTQRGILWRRSLEGSVYVSNPTMQAFLDTGRRARADILTHEELKPLIDKCRYEKNVEDQISLLYAINGGLPESEKLTFPSLITNDYVSRALDMIEERLLALRLQEVRPASLA